MTAKKEKDNIYPVHSKKGTAHSTYTADGFVKAGIADNTIIGLKNKEKSGSKESCKRE